MKLFIDIGNSRIKGRMVAASGMQGLSPLAYRDHDLAALLESWSLPDGIEACWVASVGHADVCAELAAWLLKQLGVQACFPSSTAAACGVTNAYAVPANLGVDRWLGLIAAYHRGAPAIVVSAGTAATIDAVDADGQHLGGLITPGVSSLRKAMLDYTQVRAKTDMAAATGLGHSTDSCVTYGTLQSIVGYVDSTVAKLRAQAQGWQCLITGGDADMLQPLLADDWQLSPDLVLEGLELLATEHGAVQPL